jgi:hypothetical protein
MNDVTRTSRLIDGSTGCFCVLAVFVFRMCLGLWSTASLGTRIYLVGSLLVCILGPVINHQLKKALPESAHK